MGGSGSGYNPPPRRSPSGFGQLVERAGGGAERASYEAQVAAVLEEAVSEYSDRDAEAIRRHLPCPSRLAPRRPSSSFGAWHRIGASTSTSLNIAPSSARGGGVGATPGGRDVRLSGSGPRSLRARAALPAPSAPRLEAVHRGLRSPSPTIGTDTGAPRRDIRGPPRAAARRSPAPCW